MTHTAKTPSSKVVASVTTKATSASTVSSNSLIGRMLRTKKYTKAYLKGEITLVELEKLGIELV